METLKWYNAREVVEEYSAIQEMVLFKYKDYYPEECSVPMTLPNYVVLDYIAPDYAEDSVAMLDKLNDETDEFTVTVYLDSCRQELSDSIIRSLPKQVKSCMIALDKYLIAKSAIVYLLQKGVIISKLRMGTQLDGTEEEIFNYLYNFVSCIRHRDIRHIAKIVDAVVRKEAPIALGIMDTDPTYRIPYQD